MREEATSSSDRSADGNDALAERADDGAPEPAPLDAAGDRAEGGIDAAEAPSAGEGATDEGADEGPTDEPLSEAAEPSEAAVEPGDAAAEPSEAAAEPLDAAAEPPSEAVEPPSEAVEPPSAAAEASGEAATESSAAETSGEAATESSAAEAPSDAAADRGVAEPPSEAATKQSAAELSSDATEASSDAAELSSGAAEALSEAAELSSDAAELSREGDEASEGAEPPGEGAARPRRPKAAVPPRSRPPLKRKQKAPPLPGRDPIWARVLVVFGTLLFLLSTTAVTTSRLLAHRYDNSVTKQELLAPQARVTTAPAERRSTISGPLNFLLIGSDLRVNNPWDGQRSDTVIIVHIPTSLDRAYLISIPRDLRVHIPPFADTGFRGSHEKINAAFQYGGGGAGGVQLLSQTLSDLVGIRFDGAAIIDFTGFQKAVELLGGVHMCVDVRTESHHIGYDKNGNYLAPYDGPDGEHRNRESTPKVYEPGCRHFAAWEALDYVRQRKSLPDGDYGRQRHQQQFLRAVFDRAQAKDLTSNPIALDRFIRAVGESLTVDTNGVPVDELLFGLRNVNPNTLLGLQVPSAPEMLGGISYILEKPEAEDLYSALREDSLDAWAVENPSWVNRI